MHYLTYFKKMKRERDAVSWYGKTGKIIQPQVIVYTAN